MELLVVGAGAVGSVYAYFASRHPAPEIIRVTFLIKPKHRKNLEENITLYRWKNRQLETIVFTEFLLIDTFEEVAQRNFDAVLITLPSDKLRGNNWLGSFLKVIKTAQIWSLQPNPDDREFIRTMMKAAGISDADGRLVFGSIPILSYRAPMPGENIPKEGYAFFLPPTSRASWSSKFPDEAEKVANLFTAGGLPSRSISISDASSLLPEAFLRCFVAGLKKSGWSFEQLIKGENLTLVTAAIHEMTAIFARCADINDPSKTFLGKFLSTGFGIRATLRLSKFVIPFDFETFLRVHFTKVSAQMDQGLDEAIESAKKYDLPATNLKALRG